MRFPVDDFGQLIFAVCYSVWPSIYLHEDYGRTCYIMTKIYLLFCLTIHVSVICNFYHTLIFRLESNSRSTNISSFIHMSVCYKSKPQNSIKLLIPRKAWHLVYQITIKYLYLGLFGVSRVYLVLFGFGHRKLWENLVLFDLTNSHFKSIWMYLDLVFLKGKNPNKLFLKIWMI